METKNRKTPEYKPVKDVAAIIESGYPKKEILFKLWGIERNRKNGELGCRIAEDLARKWEKETFGETNINQLRSCLESDYPEFFQKFTQVESYIDRYGKHKKSVTYEGIHRNSKIIQEIKSFMNKLNYKFKSWYSGDTPASPDEEIYLKRYGSFKDLGIEGAYRKLISFLDKEIKAVREWKINTGLPIRYYGTAVNQSIAVFEAEKSNLNYTIIKGHGIAVENIEHYEGMTGQCHGIGKILSVTRNVYFDGQMIPVRTFRSGYLLDILLKKIKWEAVHVSRDLQSVQLESCFDVKEHDAVEGFRVFSRWVFGLEYDICVMKNGITFHSWTVENAVLGWKQKAENKEIQERIKNKAVDDALMDWNIIKESGYGKEFIEFLNLDKKRKYLLSDIKMRLENCNQNIPDFGYQISEHIPFLKEIKDKRRQEFHKSNIMQSWTLNRITSTFHFCETGIKAFCRLNGLSADREYSGQDILSAVKKKYKENIDRFGSELQQMFGTYLTTQRRNNEN